MDVCKPILQRVACVISNFRRVLSLRFISTKLFHPFEARLQIKKIGSISFDDVTRVYNFHGCDMWDFNSDDL